jgi:hypothetical protein
MTTRPGVPFNALLVEYGLNRFLTGHRRRLSTQADIFRGGDPRHLGRLVAAIGKELDVRTRDLPFLLPERRQNGSAARRLKGAIAELISVGDTLKRDGRPEPNDYHWLIIGALTVVLQSVLEVYRRPSQ